MNKLHGLYAKHNILPTDEEIIDYVRQSPYFVTMLHDDLIPLVAQDSELLDYIFQENDLEAQLVFLMQKGLCRPTDVYDILNKRYIAHGDKYTLTALENVITNYSDDDLATVFKSLSKHKPNNLNEFIKHVGEVDYTELLMRVCANTDVFNDILKEVYMADLFINPYVGKKFYEEYLGKIVEFIVIDQKDNIYFLNGISKLMWQMDVEEYYPLLTHENKDVRYYTAYYFMGWNDNRVDVHKLLHWIDVNHHDFYEHLVKNICYNSHFNSYKKEREVVGLLTLESARDAILNGVMRFKDLDDSTESVIKHKLVNDIDFVKNNKVTLEIDELIYYVKKDNYTVKNFIIDKLFATDDIYSWEFERLVIKDYYLNPYANKVLKEFLSVEKNLKKAYMLYAVYAGRFDTLNVLIDANPKVIEYLDTKDIYFKHMQYNNPSRVENGKIIYYKEN